MSIGTILIVSGPTATGKSALGISLAKKLNGEIVNLDSVQVYRGADIGSAKISQNDRAGIPHHLIDIRDPGEPFDAADFIREADRAIGDIVARGKLPILVGGTTMYLSLLLQGLVALPERDPKVRAELETCSQDELFAELVRSDPISAKKIHPNDRYRIVRALEAFRSSGVAIGELRESHGMREGRYRALIVVTVAQRDTLYSKINQRAQEMIKCGLVAETSAIRSLSSTSQPLNALGYAETIKFLDGELSMEELPNEIAMNTRRFAKRQMTFWRNEPGKRGWEVFPKVGDSKAVEVAQGAAPKSSKVKEKPFLAYRYSEEELLIGIKDRLTRELTRSEVWYLEIT